MDNSNYYNTLDYNSYEKQNLDQAWEDLEKYLSRSINDSINFGKFPRVSIFMQLYTGIFKLTWMHVNENNARLTFKVFNWVKSEVQKLYEQCANSTGKKFFEDHDNLFRLFKKLVIRWIRPLFGVYIRHSCMADLSDSVPHFYERQRKEKEGRYSKKKLGKLCEWEYANISMEQVCLSIWSQIWGPDFLINSSLYVNVPDGCYNIKRNPKRGSDVVQCDMSNFLKIQFNKIYPNFSSIRGKALIINNEIFQDKNNKIVAEMTRHGSDKDKQDMTQLLQDLDYEVVAKDNLTAEQMLQEIQDLGSDPKQESYDSSIVVVLTHGNHELLMGSDSKSVKIKDLLAYLNAENAPGLNGKPKLFFIQACRGGIKDQGVAVKRFPERATPEAKICKEKVDAIFEDKSKRFQKTVHILPTEADIFVAYPTADHYVSIRNQREGSWFIQTICEIFKKHACEMHIADLMIKVSEEVAKIIGLIEIEKETSAGVKEKIIVNVKEIPSCTSQLRFQFYFAPGIYYAER